MIKYKTQYDRKFDTRVAIITGFSADEYCATLQFVDVPKKVLLQLADELKNAGYCQATDVAHDQIELIEPDLMMCELDGLNRFMREALEEVNYELSEEIN